MKKYTNFFLILFLPLLVDCKDNKDKIIDNKKNTAIVMNTDHQLKDGINISTSFIDNLEFNKYKYSGQYIEEIKVSSFDEPSFKVKFFEYLKSRNFDQNQYEQIFFIKLLLVRIQQVNDIRSYNLLSSIFNDDKLGYYLEDYELYLFQLFLYKPYFFINGEYKYKHNNLIDYINKNLPSAFLTNKEYFDNNIAEIQFKGNTLLISKDIVDNFTITDLKTQIEQNSDKIDAFFSPTFETGWENKTITYYNLYSYIDSVLTNKLESPELTLYNVRYKPFFKSYIIKSEKIESIIQDPDGYTNLRKEKNVQSEILQKIKSGEYIEVLENTGDWFLVKTKEGEKGYVHKSRIKSN
ncbi:MAG: SH3 domain-containing protein [Chryseobacterium sp.]|nr:SH3 domain-containing protein [Chryseobacterium sp.]